MSLHASVSSVRYGQIENEPNEGRSAMAKIGFWKSESAAPGHRGGNFGNAANGKLNKFGAKQNSSSALCPAEAALILKAYEESCQGWFWATDSGGCITYVTERVAPLLAGQSGEIRGTPLVDL